MPIWSYFYLFLVVLSSSYLIFYENQKLLIHKIGEPLALLSCISIFVISYEVVHISHPKFWSTLALLYMFLWYVLAYWKSYLVYRLPASEFAKTVELGENESFEDAVLSIKVIKTIGAILSIVLIAPIFYVYLKVVLSAGN